VSISENWCLHRAHGVRAIVMVAIAAGQPASAQFLESDVAVLYRITGTTGEFAGFVANALGDLNGDGASEFVLGAPGFSGGRGRARIQDGATGALLASLARPELGFFDGTCVHVAGDLNLDGINDILVGGPGTQTASSPPGRVTAYSGADFSVLWTALGEANDDQFGVAVGGLFQDADGDGHPDVLVTASRWDSPTLANAGRLYVISGADGSVVKTFNGFARQFGSGVVSIDDVDGDGLRDAAVGARQDGVGARGRVHIISLGATPSLVRSIDAPATGVDLGWFFMDASADLNRDGVNDIYVSDFNDSGVSGRALVYSGADQSLIRNIPAFVPTEGFGIGRFAPDVDNDGWDDLYLAGYITSVGAPNGGRGYVISGRTSQVIRTMTGTVQGALLGYDACALGDVNGDGLGDYLLTGQGADAPGIAAQTGVAYVIAGQVHCAADLSGSSDPNDPAYGEPDTQVDSADFFYYLDQFVAGSLARGDLSGSSEPNDPNYGVPDGFVDAADFFFYLDLFVAGCP